MLLNKKISRIKIADEQKIELAVYFEYICALNN